MLQKGFIIRVQTTVQGPTIEMHFRRPHNKIYIRKAIWAEKDKEKIAMLDGKKKEKDTRGKKQSRLNLDDATLSELF